MKILFYCFVVSALTSSPSAFAAPDDPKTEARSSATPCKECSTSPEAPVPVSVVDDAKDLLGKLNASFKCTDKTDPRNCLLIDWLKWKHHDYALNCKGFFLDAQGNLGNFSKVTASLIAGDLQQFGGDSIFTKSNPDFERLCPGFKNFTPTQKIAFHGWIFELLAFPESTCNINVKPNTAAPTTKAVCLYQLEDRPEIRKWRSSKFKPQRCAISYNQILTLEGCTGCAFDEYKRKTVKDGTPFGVIDENTGKRISGAYWASFNPLAKNQEACLQKYLDPKTGKPVMNGKAPLYLSKCAGSNNEWMPRYKFFRRVSRFPLCETEAAKGELEGLKSFQEKQTQ